MKASIVSFVFTAALAAAQDLSGLPTCATGCVTKFTTGTAIGGCQQLDIGCICKNADFLNGIACCLADACSKSDQDKAVSFAQQICSSAGVSTPDTVVCKDSSSQTGSATASDSSASSKTTDSSDSSTTGSSDSSTTATDSSSTSTDSGSTTAAPTSSSAQTTTASSTRSATSSTSTGAAAPLASAGSLVGAAIAVLAAAL
ncbi:CFEM domain-containing protein [Trichoderma gamsii]|uniref:CFEM domain-containing protein n=1 Tax=Trichoderma gamsii TaxID=398673 RepID=A0A2P4ZHS9_9HYPO|nr:CFEM domain-containing protein [Trichoderma gamsii]PON23837.1 CFEM domain-containing protein [Trichoderma gamsii]